MAPSPSGMVQEGVQSPMSFHLRVSSAHPDSPRAGGAGRGRSCSQHHGARAGLSVLFTLKLCE